MLSLSSLTSFYRLLIASLLCLILSTPIAYGSQTEPVDTGEVVGQVVSSHDVVAPGQDFYVAASTVINDHWHTYWRNPGDSGEPTDISFDLPPELTAGEIVWPLPRPIPTGPIVNYGFEGSVLFPVPFKVSDNAATGDVLEIKGSVYYLVCYDICVPEEFEFNLPLTVGKPVLDNRWDANIRRALNAAPKRADTPATMRLEGDQLIVDVDTGGAIADPYLFPYTPSVNNPSAPQTFAIGEHGARLTMAAGFVTSGGLKGPQTFLLTYAAGDDEERIGHIFTAQPGAALDLGTALSASGAADAQTDRGVGIDGGPNGASMTVLTALIGAFLGGLVLNLMPCVFPVISMKALSFARHAHDERSAIRAQGWLYTAGVIATFMLLTLVLLALKAGGTQIGWGFQLQEPWLVGLLALLVFVIGLNLIGAFEFGTGLQNVGGGLAAKEGAMGSFFTGALAVVVATPCTAPFMAGAVGFALAQPAIVTIIVFMALAIGFAAPFLLLSYSPALLAKLPKPGPWMERLKEVLAFPMFGAAIWLIWVLSLQGGQSGLLKILIAMLLLGFAIWLLKRPVIWKVLGAASVLGALALPFTIATASVSSTASNTNSKLPKLEWSVDYVEELRAQGRPVFVDFTAAWCVTCKVNELGALADGKVVQAFVDTDTAFLVADWTNRNDAIAKELEKYGRSGVPLYLYFAPDNKTVKGDILPQILTVNMLLETLEGS